MFYLLLASSIIVLYLIVVGDGAKDNRRLLIILFSIVLLFVSSFRNVAVGNDTLSYIYQFKRVASTDIGTLWHNLFVRDDPDVRDPGFEFIIKFFSFISDSGFFFLFLTSAIFLSCFAVFIYRNINSNREVLLSYLVFISYFYIIYPNSAIRQSLALGLILLIINNLVNRKKLLLSLVVILGAGFIHRSALFALFLLPFSYIRPNKTFFLSLLIILPITFIFKEQLLGLFVRLSVFSQYEVYFERVGDTNWSQPYLILIQIVLFYLLSVFCSMRFSMDNVFLTYTVYVGVSIVLLPMVWIDPSFIRIVHYFMFPICIIVPRTIASFCRKNNIASLIFILLLLIRLYVSMPDYKFNWQYMKLHQRYSQLLHNRNDSFLDGKTLFYREEA